MPRSAVTGVFTRVSNSFSNPVFGTLIDPTDADALFDDQDVGLNPAELAGPVRVINQLEVGTTGTANGSIEFFNATSGSITIAPPAGALGSVTMTLPDATDTFVGKATTDTLTNKTLGATTLSGTVSGGGNQINDVIIGTVTPLAGFFTTLTATTINGLTISTSAGTLTIPNNASAALILSGNFSTTLTATGATNSTLPSGTHTLSGLDVNETITGVKTFGAAGNVGKLVIAGTTSGSTVLNATAVASGTLTLPAATDTLVGKATTDTFTNKTFNSTGSGNVLQVSGVTVSAGQYPGEPTTGNATAGNVGEYTSSTVLVGSAVSMTTATAITITSMSIPAGDHDVWIEAAFTGTATAVSGLRASLSTTTNVEVTTAGNFSAHVYNAIAAFATFNPAFVVGPIRVSLASPTTYFFVARGDFTGGTCTGFGVLRARRAR